jgi:outer membrane lipoprotein
MTPYARMPGFVILGLLLFLISGCAYPISKNLRQEVDQSVTFPVAFKDPAAYVGKIVLWGGVVVETVNRGPKETDIIVLETPLGWDEKPKATQYSQGRFIARSQEFLDPIVYQKGRKITLAGELIGKEIRPLGKTEYAYPLVLVKELYLWEKTYRVYPQPYYYDPWFGPWYGPWSSPWYGPPYVRYGEDEDAD